MKIFNTIYIGTGEIGVELLKAMNKHPQLRVDLVVTGTDKPAGRRMELQPSPIKKMALELGLNVFQPENINATESLNKLKFLSPDLIMVMAYGQFLGKALLQLPKFECLNAHTSVLPKYRGSSPIQSAILAGDDESGISLMKMQEKMDAGPVYKIFRLKIEQDTTASLSKKLGDLTAQMLPNTLIEVMNGVLSATEQNEKKVSHVTKISKTDGNIDWAEPAPVIERKIRAFTPWPSTYTFFGDKRLKIIEASVIKKQFDGSIGEVFQEGVVCGSGAIELQKVQLEGKKAQDYSDFLNGNPSFIGSHLKNA